MSRVSSIVAVGRRGIIGTGGAMPWHLPEDFAFFKRTTMGHPLIMGRKTFESIGRVLPGRRTVVITRSRDWQHDDVEVTHSLEDALELVRAAPEVFIGGGGEIYREAMPLVDRLLITEVDIDISGDTTFPAIDLALWIETERRPAQGLAWVTYERRGASERHTVKNRHHSEASTRTGRR